MEQSSPLRLLRLTAAGALALHAALAMAQATVEVIPLHYRSSAEIIPILQPLLPRDGSISGFQSQLIIRTTPANLAEIRRVLAGIDVAPRRLLITVRQETDADARSRATEISGNVPLGERATITLPGTAPRPASPNAAPDKDGLRITTTDSRAAETDRNTQSVQVLEGYSAFIRVGQSIPVPQRTVVQGVIGGQVVDRVMDSVEYRDVTTGFYAVPRLNGERVVLEINPQRNTPNPQAPGSVNIQQAATTVSGKLGEWLEIGGLRQDRAEQQSVLLGRTTGAQANRRGIWIRVEELR